MSEPQSKGQQELASIRDTAESIWVAIVLAFVLRAFVVEAFVIPTGSMAPRLLGEHLDICCPACGYQYAFGWSPELESRAVQAPSDRGPGRAPYGAHCPTCGFDAPTAPFVSGGDRVLVMKYLYRFRPPQPWDVVVFKNPQDNRQNYIKRLIGLPGETIEIVHGDVFVRPEGEQDFRIRRKDNPKVQDAMWQVVFYNDYRADPGELAKRNADRQANSLLPIKPPRWDPNGSAQDVWKPASPDGRVFLFDGCPAGRQAVLVFKWDWHYGLDVKDLTDELRKEYRYGPQHKGLVIERVRFATDLPEERLRGKLVLQVQGKKVTTPAEFDSIIHEDDAADGIRLLLADSAGKEDLVLITPEVEEFLPRYGYNAGMEVDTRRDIVSDLRLSATFFPKAANSDVAMELSCFEHLFRGQVQADGRVRLLYGRPGDSPKAQVAWTPLAAEGRIAPLAGSGRGHEVALTNVDFRVTLWVDGRAVLASQDRDDGNQPGDGTRYPLNYRLLTQRMAKARDKEHPMPIPQPRVRIAAGGGGCELRHLMLQRDVYYTSPKLGQQQRPSDGPLGDFARDLGVGTGGPGWGVEGHPITLARDPGREDLDQFFVMGDNSPSSLDGRLWTAAAPTLRLYDQALAAEDVRWPSFAARLTQEAGSPGPTPGKRIWQALSPGIQAKLKAIQHSTPSSQPQERAWQQLAAEELNRMLSEADFYSPQAWPGIEAKLPDWAARLAARQAAGKEVGLGEQLRLNRQALEAAFPDDFAPPRRTYQLGTVPRYSMIGKAIFVYWPSGFPVQGLLSLPILPNVGKMRLIR